MGNSPDRCIAGEFVHPNKIVDSVSTDIGKPQVGTISPVRELDLHHVTPAIVGTMHPGSDKAIGVDAHVTGLLAGVDVRKANSH